MLPVKFAMTLAVTTPHDTPKWDPSFAPASVLAQCPPPPRACPAVAEWLSDHTPALKKPDPTATPREKEMAKMGVVEYIEQRKAGTVTCVEYVGALVKRVHYYRYMNQWMYWDIFANQTDYMLEQAHMHASSP